VRRRPAGTENARLPTGDVELAVTRLEVLARSLTPPFPIAGDDDIDEGLRLRYRYLDLRRGRMQRNLTVRHKLVKAMRDYFDERDFLEIETPDLIKSTPEGARDYLVPSRVHPGTFYALPQSPQILKQICMIGGLGRYMQIARCFRDEDPRADRQPEFSQLDVEMSFVTEDEVIAVMEGCIRFVWRTVLGTVLPDPLPRLTHADALTRFGSDKPDLRFPLELRDVADAFRSSDFGLFRTLAGGDGNRIVALRYPVGADGVKGPVAKFLDDATIAALRDATGAETGDALLLVGDASAVASEVAGKLRLELADRLGLRDPQAFAFCWIVGFPLFERDPETGEITFAHHPFTAPAPGQEGLFDVEPLAMRAQHYDLVLNGYELGSGSIRNHDAGVQHKIFEMLGLGDDEIAERFGFFMEALQYGAPPHGGMALGIDRVAMIACGEASIRDVIAFPKNQTGRDVMMDAPSTVPKKQLDELGLVVAAKPK
jgi:aspartyl-tRNA synthetase